MLFDISPSHWGLRTKNIYGVPARLYHPGGLRVRSRHIPSRVFGSKQSLSRVEFDL